MGLLDKINDVAGKFAPSKHHKSSGGIGNGHGMVGTDEDASPPAHLFKRRPKRHYIMSSSLQIFFNFLAMCCFASAASFQAKWKVGPSGLSGFAIFVSIFGMFLSAFMLFVPVLYERYDKFIQLARTLKEVRVGFILTGTGVTFSLLISFITTISAWTQPGCKNPDNDPHAEEKGDNFKLGLDGFCNTKKAAAIFFWLVFGTLHPSTYNHISSPFFAVCWGISLALLILDWRSGKLQGPRDPPFQRPEPSHSMHDEEDPEDDDTGYTHIPPARRPTTGGGAGSSPTATHSDGRYTNSHHTSSQSPFADPPYRNSGYSNSAYTPALQQPLAGRPSMDAYGAFSDPAPTGYGASPARRESAGPPTIPEVDIGGPIVSRTMQYADPYAAVRASIHQGPASPTGVPPSYDSYQGYR
ncbi:hypothetical protein CVT24_010314 [Panaeolus cyanescens]|uniref:MARVEL domain-containing protein n=1 Tax=Panaeolus cyanescens TaxID=181874 RepID=A0A409VAK3_9AGAR|nr:hypothetical protein CVT24_010314 [Panaeolus cyanescens]